MTPAHFVAERVLREFEPGPGPRAYIATRDPRGVDFIAVERPIQVDEHA